MENGTASTKEQGFLSRMALNDNKAGMEGLDRDKINRIIMESSKGSRFYENEVKREQQVNQRIEKMMQRKAKVTEQELKKAEVKVERMTSALERSRDLSRVIVHVDMDAFYAAVEMRDCPALKDKPMAVGSMSMLSTSNYHARKFGVRAAMPGFIARKLCPDLVIVPTNFEKYRAVSNEIREIFADYDPHFQPLSLDEAYLDFTDHLEQRQSWPESLRTHRSRASSSATGEEQSETPQESVSEAEELSPLLFEDCQTSCLLDPGPVGAAEVFGTSVDEAVREMRFRIEQKTLLTASAGIAPNMMLAKVCSDKNKPNGQYRLPSTTAAVMDFIRDLPVRKVCGIGKVSEKMLNALGVSSCSHLGQQMALLSVLFSETTWHQFLQVSLGLGSTHIVWHEDRKSMSTERTFKEVSRADEQLALCRKLCEDLAGDLKREDLKGKTVTLKLKNVNFEVRTRAVTLPHPVGSVDEIFAAAEDLLSTEIENESPQPLRLRLMGVRISAFSSLEDKKSLQKSIIGFLQPGTTDSGGPSLERPPGAGGGCLSSCPPPTQTQDGGPWRRRPGAEQQSFFQKARFQRLKAAGGHTPEDGGGSAAPRVPSTDTDSSITGDKPKRGGDPAEVPASLSVPVPEGEAPPPGRGAPGSPSLTCPVCFRQVETDDLNVFNRHIDQCLSSVSTETNRRAAPDSEWDQAREETWRGGTDTRMEQEQSQKTENREQRSDEVDPPPLRPASTPQRCESRTGPVLVCPVCQLTQDTDDLSVFNGHVDLCLNRDVLHQLGGRTPSPVNPRRAAVTDTSFPLPQQPRRGKTKRQQAPPALPSKKAKCHNTIDKFLR